MSNRFRLLQATNRDLKTFFEIVKNKAEMDFVQSNVSSFYNAKILKEISGPDAEKEALEFIASGRHKNDINFLGIKLDEARLEDLGQPRIEKLVKALHGEYGMGETDAKTYKPQYGTGIHRMYIGEKPDYSASLLYDGERLANFRDFLSKEVTEVFGKTMHNLFDRENNDNGIYMLFKHTDLELSGIKDINYNLGPKIDINLAKSKIPAELHNNAKTIVKDMVYGMIKRAINHNIGRIENEPIEVNNQFLGIVGGRTHIGLDQSMKYLDDKLDRMILRSK